MNKKIVAVVVTYNRKRLLKECIDGILNQTYTVEKIIIVDNASTDDTENYLKEKKILTLNNVEYIKLSKNIGGAGGFYTGMKKAIQLNYDWVWIMDDDTIPNQNTLKELIEASKNINENCSFLSSSVFGMKKEVMNVPILDDSMSDNGYPDWYRFLKYGCVKIKTATFVSLLIKNDAIKQCGLPVKDYFIWGDDTEYTTRLTKFYGPAFLVGSSEVLHKRIISKSLTLIEENNIDRINFFYYMIRNNFINTNEYYGKIKLIKYVLKNILLYLELLFSKTKYKKIKLKTVRKGILDGIFRKYDFNAFINRMIIEMEE
ncbi:MAG TPA: glycosyltransferase family 2 protein [Clostridia bacterium]|nr:glycosyltransferase family 2 protein [Clostridia bacterium]